MATTQGAGKRGATTDLHFVVSTGKGKPFSNPELNRFIRSYVMQGKNRGKVRPPRHPAPASPPPCSPEDEGQLRAPAGRRNAPAAPPCSSIPPRLGADLVTVSLPDNVEPDVADVVLRFCTISKSVLYPLERCILYDTRGSTWIAPLTIDPAFLHAMIFTSRYYFDSLLPRIASSSSSSSPPAPRATPHYLRTVQLLRERLNNNSLLSHSTVAAVLTLASHAFMTGDVVVARHHLEGLRGIVELNGGVKSCGGCLSKPLMEILRCDLGLAVTTGEAPVFFVKRGRGAVPSSSGLGPLWRYPDFSLLLPPDHNAEVPAVGGRAWRTMSDFCAVVNLSAEGERRVTTQVYLETMASVMYRLLIADARPSESTEGVVRLAILAFCDGVFLPWKGLGIPSPFLAERFRECLKQATAAAQHHPALPSLSKSRLSSGLAVWLLMLGRISVLDASDDEWVKPALLFHAREVGVEESWDAMRGILGRYLWIGFLHDAPAKRFFASVTVSSELSRMV